MEHAFSFDGDATHRDLACESCGLTHGTSTVFILDHGNAFAACFIEAHAAVGGAYIDATLGEFDPDEDANRVTFACRYDVRAIPEESGVALLTPVRPATKLSGRLLSRDDALVHPRIDDFWALIDWLMWNDPDLHAVMHPSAGP